MVSVPAGGLFDDFWDQVQPRFDGGGNGLEGLPLVDLGDFIGAQALHRVMRIGHGFNATGVHGLQLVDQFQYLVDAVGDFAHLRSVDPDPRQGGKFLDLVLCYLHAVYYREKHVAAATGA
jgi:hypothetical protein